MQVFPVAFAGTILEHYIDFEHFKKKYYEKNYSAVHCRFNNGCKSSAHQIGEIIGKLMDHGYKVFLSNTSLSEEIARNIAGLFNQS